MAETGGIPLNPDLARGGEGAIWHPIAEVAAKIGKETRQWRRGFLPFLILFLLWEGASTFRLVAAETLPSPEAVATTFWELSTSLLLWQSLWASLVRIAQGFLAGSLSGFFLGALMGVSRSAERLCAPLINGLRQVPIIGWIPLIIVWCGIEDLSKITFIAIGAFFPMLVNTFEGIRAVPHGYLEVGRVFGFGKLKLLYRIVIPASFPSIVSGIRLSLGASWLLVVWSEINTRSDLGIGDMLWSARESLKMDVVIVCVMVIGAVAYLLNAVLGRVEAHFKGWQGKGR